ncbi:hypothetical protein EV210_101184 [Anaerospora hongkongensis]|uniref:Uncharacterized protein n=1 Tax=Anaerospora hongkongensis TaxID=244830 RepID=A0A4R1Q4H8_9FIRM|nr:hypothetical protein [Anaerospora hongkongensis]TCL39984.1 hypothetical protein EV210_101184 [Anaerospora hongkongensis]
MSLNNEIKKLPRSQGQIDEMMIIELIGIEKYDALLKMGFVIVRKEPQQ